jgi:hypothetical protein
MLTCGDTHRGREGGEGTVRQTDRHTEGGRGEGAVRQTDRHTEGGREEGAVRQAHRGREGEGKGQRDRHTFTDRSVEDGRDSKKDRHIKMIENFRERNQNRKH